MVINDEETVAAWMNIGVHLRVPRMVTPDAGPPTKGDCHDFPRSSAATEASVSFFKKIEG